VYLLYAGHCASTFRVPTRVHTEGAYAHLSLCHLLKHVSTFAVGCVHRGYNRPQNRQNPPPLGVCILVERQSGSLNV
jgi:hypothetical protein